MNKLDDKFKIINEEIIFCKECGMEHSVKLVQCETVAIIRDEKVTYTEQFYYCEQTEERFETSNQINSNLLAARDAYRVKNNLLTSLEIKEIRKKFDLTQEELSIVAGFGAKTVTRYETKQIQDESNDSILRMFNNDYNFALEQVQRQKDKLSTVRYSEISARITGFITILMNEILVEKALKNDYIGYSLSGWYNGDNIISIEKIKNMMIMFAQNTDSVSKVKLMKLFWYCDALSYIMYQKSISGMVYKHRDYGALPIGWDKLISFNCVKKEEYIYEGNLCTRFLPKDYIDVNKDVFSDEEYEVINLVCNKFKRIGAKELSDIMHQEDIYKNTEDGEILNFQNLNKLNVKFM
ncbi:MAG: DUF4065 domain-containing protein [Clostridia bacterium]|nr:DUF4065 domain-containing protein [Clostridia bacterium]